VRRVNQAVKRYSIPALARGASRALVTLAVLVLAVVWLTPTEPSPARLASVAQTYSTTTYTYDAALSSSNVHADERGEIARAHRSQRPVAREGSAIDSGFGVAAKSGTSLVGKSYGLGTVVQNPGLAIKGFQGSKTPGHALNQVINRGVSPSMLRNTVANPKVVLRQGSGNYLHLSDDAVVVLRPDGQAVTAYGRADFRQHILDILADAG
jgi:hypothetical protein